MILDFSVLGMALARLEKKLITLLLISAMGTIWSLKATEKLLETLVREELITTLSNCLARCSES